MKVVWWRQLGQSEADRLASTACDVEDVVRGSLGALVRVIDGVVPAGDDIVVERILRVRRPVGLTPEPLRVAFVLSEEQLRRTLAPENVGAEIVMRRSDRVERGLAYRRLPIVGSP